MTQHHIRALLVRIIIFVMIGSALLLAVAPRTLAQTPPPRPTLEPTSTPTATPIATTIPTPTPIPTDSTEPKPTAIPGSRIIGTVIDLTTNAPAPGISVAVGDAQVTTDANGNYERGGLSAGSYQVALVLTAAQGTPAQGPITIELANNQTVVQHLAFRSPVVPTATPTSAPTAAPTSTPTAAPAPPTPTTQPKPPATLPDTGASAAGAASYVIGVLGLIVLLLGVSIWSITEWSRRNAVKRRSL
jgi:hypothetical protein